MHVAHKGFMLAFYQNNLHARLTKDSQLLMRVTRTQAAWEITESSTRNEPTPGGIPRAEHCQNNV